MPMYLAMHISGGSDATRPRRTGFCRADRRARQGACIAAAVIENGAPRFFSRGTIEVGADGKATGLVLHQNGQNIPGSKQ